MCLILKQSSTDRLTDVEILDIFRRNADGFGIMFSENGKLITKRTCPKNGQHCIDLYNKWMSHVDPEKTPEVVFHWRMGTHGVVSGDNAHPFRLSPTLSLMHNGILTWAEVCKTKSDTALFVDFLMKSGITHINQLVHPELEPIITRATGSGVLIFMDNDGKMRMVGGKSGIEHKNRWYSNTYAWSAPMEARFGHYYAGYAGYAGYDSYDREFDYAYPGVSKVITKMDEEDFALTNIQRLGKNDYDHVHTANALVGDGLYGTAPMLCAALGAYFGEVLTPPNEATLIDFCDEYGLTLEMNETGTYIVYDDYAFAQANVE